MLKLKLTLLGIAIGLFAALPALASEADTQRVEASEFLSQLLQSTQNPLIAHFAEESLQHLQEKKQMHQVEVGLLSQLNNSLAVPVVIDRKFMATFIVDTGASYTIITPRFAQKLGVEVTPETPRITILTANGAVNVPLVKIKRLSIGDVEVQDVTAVIQSLNNNDILLAGVLGMDYFKNMDMTIKQNKLILSISQRMDSF